MNKILFAVLLLLFFACDDIPDEVVESLVPDYQVVSVSVPDVVSYNGSDVDLEVSVEFEDVSTISSVWFDIVSEDGSSEIKSNVELADNNGDYTYTGETSLGASVAEGKYVLGIFVEDNQRNSDENVAQVVSHTFQFYTTSENSAPVLSNLSIADTVSLGVYFQFSVEVSDSNGLSDIDSVYYEIFDPDGEQLVNSSNISKFPLSDAGDTDDSGDEEADDGTYTMILAIPSSYSSGDWTMKFTAVDNSGANSNQLTHTLTVR